MITDAQLRHVAELITSLRDHASEQANDRHDEREELGYLPEPEALEYNLQSAASLLESMATDLMLARTELRELRVRIFNALGAG